MHSNEINFLTNNGIIFSYDDNTHRLIKCDKVDIIVSFAGYIFALKNKLLYILDSNYQNHIWKWKYCDWTPSDILYIHTTPDYKYLILQTLNAIYFYNNINNIYDIQYIEPNFRILKYDNNFNFISIDYENNNLIYDNDIYNNIKDAVLVNNKLYFIKQNEPYTKIRICNEEVYYI